MKKTQLERVRTRIRERGLISRNECLNVKITRLSAIINQLKNEGWEFEAENWRGDYRYFLKKAPPIQEKLL